MLIPLRLAAWATPVRTTFLVSGVLSLTARLSSTINRDGMLYVDTARIFMESGFGAAKAAFAWPFLSILMAIISQLTGLGLENAGYLLNALFMAGACALLVASASHQHPDAAWAITLVTLALPGLNEYRNELLREYGCWFFIMLAFWLALRWSEKPRWVTALPVQASIIAAALFRPEALAIFSALVLWQLFEAPRQDKWRRVAMIGGLPFLGLIALLALYFSGQLSTSNRLSGELARFGLAGFDTKAQALSAALNPYAREKAHTILFFGSLAIIPLKFVLKIGVFIVPLGVLFTFPNGRSVVKRYSVFLWGFFAHVLVLAVFVLDLQFLAGRYVGLLLLLSAPLTAVGLSLLVQRYARWRVPMIGVAVLIMIANVISLNPGKTQFVQAGTWLAANASESSRIYIESGRAIYHAGWKRTKAETKARTELADAVKLEKYDLLVFEVSRKEPAIEPWFEEVGLQVVQRFYSSKKDGVIIAAPVAEHVRKMGQ